MQEQTGRIFPDDFYWGSGTSSFQVEGGIENMDWEKAAQEGRVPPIGRACDHYNRYEEDFDLVKELGHNAHRFSIEWARIEPKEGEFDESAIVHYREILKALREREIEPFVTLWHFTLPLWFSESGGFERKDSPEIFARYCTFVVERLGDLAIHFSTINEALPYTSNGWRRGTWPPFNKWPGIDTAGVPRYANKYDARPDVRLSHIVTYFHVLKNLAQAHNRAYDEIKRIHKDAVVSIVHHVLLFHSDERLMNRLKAWLMNWHWTHQHMSRVYKKCDWIGLNYYMHKKFGDTAVYPKSDMGWDVYPEGIHAALHMLARYKKPLYVSEAGIADEDDDLRPEYIRKQVTAVRKAIEDGIDVRGHMYWSLMDNYELALGYEKRFGLIEIDYVDLTRTPRPSAHLYREIIKNNGIL